jgi:decaprenyl-phosphate phosphoribosyltransferase
MNEARAKDCARARFALVIATTPPYNTRAQRMTIPHTLSLPVRSKLRGHIEIARIDHWFKNVFVLPGIVAGISADYQRVPEGLGARIVLGLISICLVASSNYVVNEVLDAPSDLAHPVKRLRPVPAGHVNVPLAYVQWIALMLVGVALGRLVSAPFAITVFVLWMMGCVYNIRPLRSKDVPYVDVLSEAVNNPIRLLAGWFIVDVPSLAPASLLLSYWMVGCYFMALKRYSEYRAIANPTRAAAYRKSFAFYTEERLLVAVMFYASAAMLFLGAFVMRYRLELILAFPLIALVMAVYLLIAFKPDSTVQRPEGLYKEPRLMIAVCTCAAVIAGTMFVDVPVLHHFFAPTAPTNEIVPPRELDRAAEPATAGSSW